MGEIQQYLVSSIQHERFAIDIRFVHEILKQPAITKIPTKVSYLIGLIKVRDHVVPLVSIRKKFYSTDELAPNPVVIIVQEPHLNKLIGLIVDEVDEVVAIPDESIDHPALFSGRDGEDMVSGVGKLESGLVIIMDGNRLFSDLDQQAFEKAIKTGEKKGV